ncbi:cbb3-type cytochrome oxidase assembly protein CcoS [Neiella marina]|uniref:Cbb3-type cytochrome oxidase assembly protein CcoS n=1 Tax=Neiella holothuriorum TaxID=2870530 RepID=A0ABS7EGN2_9GAMM|nr:cbb3-type cytochrome oxidase assembly protein CcoS [Neiella holothuriorum]MBW8191514.1 cbb3-type cytochrome oxidase assembly protein CcoS [Neiella holothuriorum]
MAIIYVLIPIAILFVFVAIGVFIWAVKSDQFDDLERHGTSVLFDDDEPKSKQAAPPKSPNNPPNDKP